MEELRLIRCENVHNFNSTELQCKFVRNTSDCLCPDGLFNYVEIIYCHFNHEKVDSVIIYGLWISFLFVVLGLTTDKFFCPALDVISKSLRLSQNVAGVTFLAFGNGAPDIFSSLAATSQNRPELVISGLFGAGIFVSSVVAGCIMLLGPFHIEEFPFLRDGLFYLAAAFWAFSFFYIGHITLVDALGFLVLYVVYIFTVLLGPRIYVFLTNTFGSTRYTQIADGAEEADSLIAAPGDGSINDQDQLIELNDNDDNDFSHFPNSMQLTLLVSYSERTPLLTGRRNIIKNELHRWKSLAQALNPIDKNEWNLAFWNARVFMVIKAPFVFILKLTIPLISPDKPRNNWCQLLNALHCLIVPIFITFSTKNAFIMCGSLPVWSVVLIIGGTATIIVLLTSKPNTPPIYHTAFGYLGFVISIVWIYNIANEIVNVLKAIGVVFNINDAVLGLTVLAWGNSIGDFVANYSVAKNGSKVMAISACFGGPLLNLLVGMGLPFTIQYFRKNSFIKVEFDNNVLILSCFLFVSLCSTLIALVIMKFNVRKTYGFYLLFLYLTFSVIIVLNACDIFI